MVSTVVVPDGLRIGELAELAGVTVKAVRHYHRQGLLAEPPRLANGYRAYLPEHLVVLVRIRKLRDSGMSLAAIREVLGASRPADAVVQLKELLREMERQREELDRRLASLRVLVDGLGSGESIETSDPAPPSFVEVEARLRELGGSQPVLETERRVWAVLDAVSWGAAVSEGVRQGFAALVSDRGRAAEVAGALAVIFEEIEAGASSRELVPLVEDLVARFPPRSAGAVSESPERAALGALAMAALPAPLIEALRLVRGDAEGRSGEE